MSIKYQPRLKERYILEIKQSLKEEFSYSNIMQVPILKKIVISKGVGEATSDKKAIDYSLDEISNIAGQKAVVTYSKKDVASFKLRKKVPIGVKVTLRRDKMYEFLDRFVSVSLPRVRDFNGVDPLGFDGRGNYNLGITEQIIFPEIDIDKINKIGGMNLSFVTSTNSDKESRSLLQKLGLPFKKIK